MKKVDKGEKILFIVVIVVALILLCFAVYGEVKHKGNVGKLLLYLFGGLGLMSIGTWVVAKIYKKSRVAMPSGGVYAAMAQANINAREEAEKRLEESTLNGGEDPFK